MKYKSKKTEPYDFEKIKKEAIDKDNVVNIQKINPYHLRKFLSDCHRLRFRR